MTERDVAAAERALPLGAPVDSMPAALPGLVVLAGRFGRVEKLDASRHGDELWEAVRGHDHIWTYMSYGPFADAAAFLQRGAALGELGLGDQDIRGALVEIDAHLVAGFEQRQSAAGRRLR